VSFDVVSLFTKVPADLAVDIAKQRLLACDDLNKRTEWSVDNICQGHHLCLESTHLNIPGTFFEQTMGSPVSSIVANLMMEYVENRALENPPGGVETHLGVRKRYVDDTFAIINRAFSDQFFAFYILFKRLLNLLWSWKLILPLRCKWLPESVSQNHHATLLRQADGYVVLLFQD